MENENNKVKLLELDIDDITFFSEADTLLRSGKYIQNVEKQLNSYDFISKYLIELKNYYNLLFDAKLEEKGEEPNNYFYLHIEENSNTILKQNSKKLKQEYHLFGILLLKIIRVDKYFSSKINVQELKKVISNNIEYQTHINRLFAQSDKPTEVGEKTIDMWIAKSLSEFNDLCWIHFPNKNDKDLFEPLPAIDRLMTLYNYQIQNIDMLFKETDKIDLNDAE